MRSSSRQRKERLFRQGVKALQAIGVDTDGEYVCPLCLHGFRYDQIEALTHEHVPPKSLKGNWLVLTCLRCNHRASGPHGVDTHARRLEHHLDLLRGTMPEYLAVDFGVNDQRTGARLRHIKGKGFDIRGLPDSSPPGSSEAVQAELMGVRPGSGLIKVRLRGQEYDFEKHKVSWLRSAYLAAFAAFGYRYAARPELNCVREKIESPENCSLTGFHAWKLDGEPGTKQIAIVSCGPLGEGILVTFGQHLVLLPWFQEGRSFYERTSSSVYPEEGFMYEGMALDWPSPPRMEWDFISIKADNPVVSSEGSK